MAARRRKGRKPVRPRRRKAQRAKPRKVTRRKPARRPGASTAGQAQPRAGPLRLVAGVPVEVGVVEHYFGRAGAAVVALSRPIRVGDTIHVRGQTTDFVQQVSRLALDGAPVREGTPPQSLGLRLEARARPGDRVYRISW